MAFFVPYSDSSTYYSYSPEITVSVETDKHRKYKIESVPVTSSYYLPNSIYDTSYFYPTNYSYPVYQNISYLDVNQDKDLHKKLQNIFILNYIIDGYLNYIQIY